MQSVGAHRRSCPWNCLVNAPKLIPNTRATCTTKDHSPRGAKPYPSSISLCPAMSLSIPEWTWLHAADIPQILSQPCCLLSIGPRTRDPRLPSGASRVICFASVSVHRDSIFLEFKAEHHAIHPSHTRVVTATGVAHRGSLQRLDTSG